MTYQLHSHTITFAAALRDLQSESDQTRAMAAHALGGVVEPEDRTRAVSALIDALDDAHPPVRSEAALALGDLESESAVEPLIARMTDDVPLVRQSAAVALGRLGFASSFDAMVETLQTGAPDVRFQAATSLAEIDPERAGPHLLRALDDGDGEVVGAVAVTLGDIGERTAIEPLVAALEHWRTARTRFDIAYALAELGDERAVPVLADFVAHPELAWDAIASLQRTGHPDALPTLAALLERKRLHPSLQLRAAAAVLALGDSARADEKKGATSGPSMPARRALLAGLRARKLEIRGLAVSLLADVGGPWALSDLRTLARKRAGRKLIDEIALAERRIGERHPDAQP